MITRILLSILLLTNCLGLSAQRVLSSKNGIIKFNASTPVETIRAINLQAESKLAEKTGQLVVSVLIKGFKFDNQLMQDHFNENYLESTKYPRAVFKGYINKMQEIDLSKNGIYPITADGTLTLHGVSQRVITKGNVMVNSGGVTIESIFKVALRDYNINGSYIGDKIAREVEVSVKCKFD